LNRILSEEESAKLWNTILEEAENMPALPDIVNKVLEEIDNPNTNAKDMEAIISKDPVLTAKVLKMSNSAYYGYSREIVTLSEAIIILGLDTLKSLVIAASAFKSLNKDYSGYGLSKGDLWRHSLATALAARLIAKQKNQQDLEKFFVAGLLHDIGKVLLTKYIGEYIDAIKQLVKMRDISFDIAEKEIIGFNHADVGAEIANYWKLPPLFYDVIKYHHSPSLCNSENARFVEFVHIADIVAYRLKIGIGMDGAFYKANKDIFTKYGIDKKFIDSMYDKINASIKDFDRALG